MVRTIKIYFIHQSTHGHLGNTLMSLKPRAYSWFLPAPWCWASWFSDFWFLTMSWCGFSLPFGFTWAPSLLLLRFVFLGNGLNQVLKSDISACVYLLHHLLHPSASLSWVTHSISWPGTYIFLDSTLIPSPQGAFFEDIANFLLVFHAMSRHICDLPSTLPSPFPPNSCLCRTRYCLFWKFQLHFYHLHEASLNPPESYPHLWTQQVLAYFWNIILMILYSKCWIILTISTRDQEPGRQVFDLPDFVPGAIQDAFNMLTE